MQPGTNPAGFDNAFETADDIRAASVHPITMKSIAELKCRHVFRVAIACMVASWLVLQVSDVVLNNISAPPWVFRIIMLLVGIYFPLVLIFAWAFELTPDGLRRERPAAAAEPRDDPRSGELMSSIGAC